MSLGENKFDDFKTTSVVRRLNLWAQIVLGVTLYLGLNFLAARHYQKWDFSENRKNSLSPESVAYVRNLKAPVEIFAIVSQYAKDNEEVSVLRDLRSILKQYEYNSLKSAPVKSHFVNAHIENKKAEELASRFGSDLENSVVVASGNRFKRIPIVDFYDIEAGKRTNFKGEQLLSSAILSVSSGKTPTIYFLKGHGELSPDDSSLSRGLSEFAGALSRRNYNIEELDLSKSSQIPENADMIIIAGARATMLPNEIDQLRKYLLKDNGRMAIFLDMGSLNGLEDVLFDWGIMSDDMLILDTSGDYESAGGDLIARSFPQKAHPISRYLIDADMPVQFGSVRPVRPDMGAPIDDTLKLDPLILSGNSSWAEKSYARGGRQVYDSATDLEGPLPLAMIASRSGGKDLGLNIPGGKLAVFGDENFIINKWFNRLGNSKLALNTINWMLEENTMLNIPSRQISLYTITLSHNQIMALALRYMSLPAAILLLALIVSFARRR